MAVNQNYQAEVGVKFNDTKLNKQLKSLSGKTVTLNVKVQGGLGNLNKMLNDTNKLLSESKSLLGQVGTASKNLDKNVRGLDSSTKKLNGNMSSTGKNTKKVADAFNHTANHGKTLSKLFTDITKKVSAFGIVTQALLLLKQGMQEAVDITVNYNEALTDFTKVSDLSGTALDKYTKKLGEMGKEVFRTRTSMLENATLMRQAGFDEETSANLAKLASMYQNVADSQVSASDASGFLVSQMKAFKIEASDAIVILDTVNEISNLYAVSTTDLSNALTANSSSLAAYGNTLSQSAALITAG